MNFSRLSVLVWIATSVSILATISPSQALSKTFNLNPQLQFGTGSATGTVTFDDSLFTPNRSQGSPFSTTGLDGFQINFTGLSSTPSATTFDLSNLNGWVLNTNSSSQIIDLNFFSSTNADDFSLSGGSEFFTFNVFQGNSRVASFSITPPGATAVPFDIPGGATIPAVGGLLALGLMRKARKSLASNTRFSKPMSEIVN